MMKLNFRNFLLRLSPISFFDFGQAVCLDSSRSSKTETIEDKRTPGSVFTPPKQSWRVGKFSLSVTGDVAYSTQTSLWQTRSCDKGRAFLEVLRSPKLVGWDRNFAAVPATLVELVFPTEYISLYLSCRGSLLLICYNESNRTAVVEQGSVVDSYYFPPKL